jgi:hypothetical protein
MPTTLYLRNATIGIDTPSFNTALGDVNRGASVTQTNVETVAGATWISILNFATLPLDEAFTLSGQITCNLRGLESNGQANASLGVRFYKWTRADGVGAQIAQASSTVELATSEAARTATVTPPSTSFAIGDALIMEVGAINIGAMGGGRGVTFYYNGPTAGASGDSYVTIAENLKFLHRVAVTG